MRHVLILGGTTEGRRLAEALAAAAETGPAEGAPGERAAPGTQGAPWAQAAPGTRGAPAARAPRLRVTSSLAGRVARPVLPPGDVRVGGFGGAEGLAAWLREHRVDAVIDATHPFAETITYNAARAAAACHVPLLLLRRPGWVPRPGDDWRPAASLAAAAGLLAAGPWERVFLTTGRTGLGAFAHLDRPRFLVRSVDPPEPPVPPRLDVLVDRGPFTLEGEREVLRRYAVDVLVTKDSGGAATAPKLTAARETGIPVIVVTRPATPEGVETADTVEAATAWALRRAR
ncbi:cobalt-precorrin-6A reductase [Streptomyces sp. NPDC047002]|uniref:cobalt-precorrin-6A reductase n=1 Tax=Streptomyces sp. NPDC047002 TaxID=3155475 RepID=UPI0034538F10